MISKGAAGAIAELIFCSMLWGFGFVSAVWALKAVNAFEMTLLRFSLAAGVSALILLPGWRKIHWRPLARLSFWPALFLFATIVFQTWGLNFTSATKSGFITTLYVVFVPLLESFHLKRKIPWSLWLCVLGSLLGTLLIVNVGLNSVNLGDALTFVCAVFATFQIYYMGLVSPTVKNPFAFNGVQSLWCAAFSLPFIFHDNLPGKLNFARWEWTSIAGLMSLAFGSTLIAFFLQVRAQARLTPTVASLLCLMESPFAMMFAMYLLNERLGALEACGAVLIFVSAVGASYIESTAKKR